MPINTVLNGLFFLFAVLGATDYLLDNRLGLGAEFERGLGCAGKLIICMTGFMSLAPVLGQVLTPLVSPLFIAIGADPSALAGMLLANDAGGAALAMEMALDPEAGAFHGYIVASMLGGTVMCIIPMTMLSTDARTRPAAIYGLVIGLFSVPFGCAVGGFAAGFSVSMLWRNLIPVSALSLALFLALVLLHRWILRPFQLLGKLLVGVSLIGLLLTAAREMFGIAPVAGMESFSVIMPIIGNIVLLLSGVFPLLALISRMLRNPLRCAAAMLGIGEPDVSSLLVTAVNLFPTFDRLNAMTAKGALLNTAFMVGANCLIGDHFAFTSQMNSPLVVPMLVGKAVAGGLALLLAAVLSPRLLAEDADVLPPRSAHQDCPSINKKENTPHEIANHHYAYTQRPNRTKCSGSFRI